MPSLEVEQGQVWKDLDKRNTGDRLVQVLGLVWSHNNAGQQIRYAVCETLTAGGRPCRPEQTSTPERIGKGLVGELTLIRRDRLLQGRFYALVTNLAA